MVVPKSANNSLIESTIDTFIGSIYVPRDEVFSTCKTCYFSSPWKLYFTLCATARNIFVMGMYFHCTQLGIITNL